MLWAGLVCINHLLLMSQHILAQVDQGVWSPKWLMKLLGSGGTSTRSSVTWILLFTSTASPKPLQRPGLKLPEHGVAFALSKRVGWEDGWLISAGERRKCSSKLHRASGWGLLNPRFLLLLHRSCERWKRATAALLKVLPISTGQCRLWSDSFWRDDECINHPSWTTRYSSRGSWCNPTSCC